MQLLGLEWAHLAENFLLLDLFDLGRAETLRLHVKEIFVQLGLHSLETAVCPTLELLRSDLPVGAPGQQLSLIIASESIQLSLVWPYVQV